MLDCPSCLTPFDPGKTPAGGPTACPGCGNRLRVPSLPATTLYEPPAAAGAEPPVRRPTPPEGIAVPFVRCPACLRRIEVFDHEFGGAFECAACNARFVPTRPAAEAAAPAPRPGFDCPFCHSDFPPGVRRQITGAAWVVFVLLLLSCAGALFCWLPLVLMRQERRYCQSCGVHLD